MTDLQAYEAPRKKQYWMVEFALQDDLDTVYRFTDYTSDVEDEEENTYTSVPSMSVRLPESTGVLDKKPCVIEAPITGSAFFDRATDGTPMPEVIVSVREGMLTFADDDEFGGLAFEAFHFQGRLHDWFRNAGGKSDTVRLEAVSQKGRTEIPVGLQATKECANIFRQSPCGAEAAAAAEEQLVTISTVVGTTVTITMLPGVPGVDGDIFEFGSMVLAGVRIRIRKWKLADPTVFVLDEFPPLAWVATTVVRIRPGCHRDLVDCERWGQVLNSRMLGIKMPNRQPVQEVS